MQVTSGSTGLTAGATGVASDSSSLVMTSGAEGSLYLAVETGCKTCSHQLDYHIGPSDIALLLQLQGNYGIIRR